MGDVASRHGFHYQHTEPHQGEPLPALPVRGTPTRCATRRNLSCCHQTAAPALHAWHRLASSAPSARFCVLMFMFTPSFFALCQALNAGMRALKTVGVTGVMVDVWWGVVEADGPGQYDWSAYKALAKIVASAGLKLHAVMSFHACGCNVGDYCTVTLPPWVLEVAERTPDVFYTDRAGKRSDEYLSLGCGPRRGSARQGIARAAVLVLITRLLRAQGGQRRAIPWPHAGADVWRLHVQLQGGLCATAGSGCYPCFRLTRPCRGDEVPKLP